MMVSLRRSVGLVAQWEVEPVGRNRHHVAGIEITRYLKIITRYYKKKLHVILKKLRVIMGVFSGGVILVGAPIGRRWAESPDSEVVESC